MDFSAFRKAFRFDRDKFRFGVGQLIRSIYSGLIPGTYYGQGFTEKSILATINHYFPVWYKDRVLFPATGLQFLFRADPSYCCSDLAHTTPCNDGDAIAAWQDRVSGIWYTQSTPAARPVLRANGIGWYSDWTTSTYFNIGTYFVKRIFAGVRQTGGTLPTIIGIHNQDYELRKATNTSYTTVSWGQTPYVNGVSTTVSGGLGVDESVQFDNQYYTNSYQLDVGIQYNGSYIRPWVGRIYCFGGYNGTIPLVSDIDAAVQDCWATV